MLDNALEAFRRAFPERAKFMNTLQIYHHANDLLCSQHVKRYIKQLQRNIAKAAAIDPAHVVRRIYEMAFADANEIVQHRRVNCRYCWGWDHAYQWTQAEFSRAIKSAKIKKEPYPDNTGGTGFKPSREPNPECPECDGEGVPHVHITDSRRLVGGNRHMYAGVEQTKHGVKVVMHDRVRMITELCRILGISKDTLVLVPDEDGNQAKLSEAQYRKIRKQMLDDNDC